MPDCRVRKVLMSRAMVGIELMAAPGIWLPTVAFRICNSTLGLSTWTVCLAGPTFSVTLLLETSPSAMTSFRIDILANPTFVKVMS